MSITSQRILWVFLSALAICQAASAQGKTTDKEPRREPYYWRKPDYWRKPAGGKATEAAIVRGLQWLARNQHAQGHWELDGQFPDKGRPNDVAGAAFGLLPFLAVGQTHKASKHNPYDKTVAQGLAFLRNKQDPQNGSLGESMYVHALATLALCEVYGMTRDPQLKKPAQQGVDHIISAQHAGGGWRYQPGQEGDLSVTGWQIGALHAAKLAGLDVPKETLRKAVAFVDSCENNDSHGYGYVAPEPTSPTMTAVGLFCRQHLQAWDKEPRLAKGVENFLLKNPPGSVRNIYYHYYANQVMYHRGGDDWKAWKEKMVEHLIGSQERNAPDAGSWSSQGDAFSAIGGRVMQTSLSLLILEGPYRYLPLFDRDSKR